MKYRLKTKYEDVFRELALRSHRAKRIEITLPSNARITSFLSLKKLVSYKFGGLHYFNFWVDPKNRKKLIIETDLSFKFLRKKGGKYLEF